MRPLHFWCGLLARPAWQTRRYLAVRARDDSSGEGVDSVAPRSRKSLSDDGSYALVGEVIDGCVDFPPLCFSQFVSSLAAMLLCYMRRIVCRVLSTCDTK